MNLRETKRVARQLARRLQNERGGVVLIDAPMGAGKTTLVREIVKILDPSAAACSPTYTIINQYNDHIFHADLYRAQTEIGLEDLCVPENYVFVEWAGDFNPPQAMRVQIKVKENGDREFIIAG